jgi:phosphomannomutase
MAQSGRTLSELVSALPSYVIVKDKYEVSPARLPSILKQIESRWPEAAINRLDGFRLDWPDHWLHVRPSNTEPVVRVIAEAPDQRTAETLCGEVGHMITAD